MADCVGYFRSISSVASPPETHRVPLEYIFQRKEAVRNGKECSSKLEERKMADETECVCHRIIGSC